MKNREARTEKLFASVSYSDGKILKVYQVISAEELKKLAKMVEQGKLTFSNTTQALSAN